ncbi:MAG: lactate racemase domain-containing protein [Deltaproteobacteria bacterium]|nr:lactate racemase domain-containing protein [Deltaproteobacteria bacterium]
MNHPCVVTLDRKSPPRTLFSGDRLVKVDLPAGTRVIYPKSPLAGLKDPDAAIRYAINHPYGCAPLYAQLRPGMKVVIAVDDISVCLPPMKRPDVRQRVLEIVLEMLGDHGVDDFEIIIATSFHRRMRDWEIRNMLGDKIFNAYYPKRLYNHDAEDAAGMKYVGETDRGEKVVLNRKAVESDLLIYINLNLVPMDGGHKSVTVGLCGYESLKPHHNPHVMRKCQSYMDPPKSELNTVVQRMGEITDKALNVFTIETTINNRMFDKPLGFLAKKEEDYTGAERAALDVMIYTLDRTPDALRQQVFQRVPSPYELTGVWAGKTEAVHPHTLKKCFEQYVVPVTGQADIVVAGVPYISPYNINAFLNPLLVQVMVQGYLHNLYRGVPVVKKGGVVIVTHPCTDRFDPDQHAPYIEFVHRVLPETRDAMVMHKKYEEEFSKNPAYIELYRKGHAYHPVHPFYMWYWGEAGRQHTGRVIVVGADNEYIPKLLGYETARTMADAIEMAKDTVGMSPDITCMHIPPIGMVEVTVPKSAEILPSAPSAPGGDA